MDLFGLGRLTRVDEAPLESLWKPHCLRCLVGRASGSHKCPAFSLQVFKRFLQPKQVHRAAVSPSPAALAPLLALAARSISRPLLRAASILAAWRRWLVFHSIASVQLTRADCAIVAHSVAQSQLWSVLGTHTGPQGGRLTNTPPRGEAPRPTHPHTRYTHKHTHRTQTHKYTHTHTSTHTHTHTVTHTNTQPNTHTHTHTSGKVTLGATHTNTRYTHKHTHTHTCTHTHTHTHTHTQTHNRTYTPTSGKVT